VRQLLARLAEDPAADAAELAATLGEFEARSRHERELAELAQSEVAAHQVAAVRLLAHVATGRSLRLLFDFHEFLPTRAAAAPGIARLADPVSLARLAHAEREPTLQRQLLAGLLERGQNDAVTLFLNFVIDPRTSRVALDAVDAVADPPVDLVFQRLDDRYYPARMAAARVLGRIDGPVVTERLATMVERRVNRREALVALVSSPGQDAAQFLAEAEHRPALAAAVHAARLQLQTVQ
jgi:hypothetical protein